MTKIDVYASPLPFSNKRVKAHADVGSTIYEIIEQICPPQLREAGIGAVAMINGQIVPRSMWRSVRPKLGTVININLVPQGGGGGKNPFSVLLSIALTIAAPGIGTAFGTSLGLGVLGTGVLTATQTAFFNGLVSAAVGIVGKLIISALAPPPKQNNNGGAADNPAESPTLFIEGARNSINPFGTAPLCLGTNRVVPHQAARPYTEAIGNDQFVRQLFHWSIGTVVISDLKIGETALSQFTDVDLEHKLEGNLADGVELFANDVFQEDFSILLEEVGGFATRTTQIGADEAIVDLSFPGGLGQFNTQAKRISRTVQLEMQYAPTGVTPQVWSAGVQTFKPISPGAATVQPSRAQAQGFSIFPGPGAPIEGYRKDLVVMDQASGGSYIVQGTSPATTEAAAVAPSLPSSTYRLATISMRTVVNNSTNVATTTVLSFTDDRQPALIGTAFENSGDFLVSIAGLAVTIAAGGLKVTSLDYTASQAEALRRSVRIVFPTSGQYDIRVRRVTGDSVSDQIIDKVFLSAIKTVKYQTPVKQVGVSGTAMRIKATDQLNGTVDQFNALVGAVIPDYNS